MNPTPSPDVPEADGRSTAHSVSHDRGHERGHDPTRAAGTVESPTVPRQQEGGFDEQLLAAGGPFAGPTAATDQLDHPDPQKAADAAAT
ncbi:hypothetical protein GT002_13895, partial [Streptomyces sp. SID4917]